MCALHWGLGLDRRLLPSVGLSVYSIRPEVVSGSIPHNGTLLMSNQDSTYEYTPLMLERIISYLNKVTGNDGTKNFQDQILSSGTFGFLCPIMDKIIYPQFNFYEPRLAFVIYLFEAAERMALVAERVSRGSPIVWAISKTHWVQADSSKGRGMNDELKHIIGSALNGLPKSTPKIDSNMKPKFYCGHINFAHFFWNELSTLDRSIFGPREIDTYILKDPFNLRLRPPYSGKLVPVERHDTIRGWNASIVFLGTATCLPDTARIRFLRSIINEQKPKRGKIYISIRPEFIHSYLVNQEYFLCKLIQAFHDTFGDMEFVLDGFSTPEDLERPTYTDSLRQKFYEIAKQSNLIISNIQQTLNVPEKNILNITGMNLSDALEIISSCSYYVTHADTQLKKIASLFPRNGIVHSNQGRISDSYITWLATHSECSIVSSTISSENITNVDTDWKPKGRGFARKENYIIKDINLAVSQVIEDYSIACSAKHDSSRPIFVLF